MYEHDLFEGSSPVSIEANDVFDWASDPNYISEHVKSVFLNDVMRIMTEKDMTQAELASKIGKTRQYVNRVLNYKANFTIKSMVEIGCGLGHVLDLGLVRPEQKLMPVDREFVVYFDELPDTDDADAEDTLGIVGENLLEEDLALAA